MFNFFRRANWVNLKWASALVFLIVATWCVIYERTNITDFSTPIKYGEGDDILGMALIKAASEGVYTPLMPKTNPSLGAPYSANWNDWPITEDFLFFALGLSSNLIGLGATCNMGVLLAHILAGISFFCVCRFLRYRPEWSFLCAFAFAFSHYSLVRSFPHIVLTYYWHIPLYILVGWWGVSRSGLSLTTTKYWISALIAFVTGIQNPYYTNIFIQFLFFGLITYALRRQTLKQSLPLLSLVFITLLAFIAMNADSIINNFELGGNESAVARSYAGLEIYALKPIELVLPQWWQWPHCITSISTKYAQQSFVKGELGSPYLGLLGVAALVWLFVITSVRLLSKKAANIPIHATQILWIGLYSIIGGLNCLIGLFGLLLFRGTNRLSIVILCILLLFLARQLSLHTNKIPQPVRYFIVLLLLVLVYLDQIPAQSNREFIKATEIRVNSDRNFVKTMESALPPETLVFQLPVSSFPEHGPIVQMPDYSHLRPYLHSSTISFSYGMTKGRQLDLWQKDVESKPASEMISELEKFGFGAIYINRAGYMDNGRLLINSLHQAGRTVISESPLRDLVCIQLSPAITPISPNPLLFNKGFHSLESDATGAKWHWSKGNAQIAIHNSLKHMTPVHVDFSLIGVASKLQAIELQFNGDEIASFKIMRNTPFKYKTDLVLRPGQNIIEFKTFSSPVKIGADPRWMAFQLRDFKISSPKSSSKLVP